MKKYSKYLPPAVIILIFYFIANRYSSNSRDDIMENRKIATAMVINISMNAKGYPCVEYEFNYNLDKYTGSSCYSGLSYQKCRKELVGISVPLVFSRRNPENNNILLDAYDYKHYDLEMPDTAKVLFRKIESWLK